jgi:teichuronic acid biosynthesis glycosyltransferase TuaC
MIKVLFVSRHKAVFGMGRFVLHQAESLRKNGVEVDHFTIKGSGIKGYIKSYKELKAHIKNHNYDIIHSHYIYSSIVASLALRNKKRLVISLLGSDLQKSRLSLCLIRFFVKHFCGQVIVKSQKMYKILGVSQAHVAPNGVNTDRFCLIDKHEAKQKVGFTKEHNILFFSNPPDRVEKNLKLAKEAFSLLDQNLFELHVLSKTPNEEVPYYMNAADVLLMTSLHEGSPNVIKEAMACNLPIVSVDVGDVKIRTQEVKNCHIVSYSASEIKEKLQEVAINNIRTNGREELIKQGLDENSVAQKIISIYNKLLS